MGTFGDRIGRRRLLMFGSAGFVAASLLAAYAPSAELLIVARAVLGVSGAAVVPSTLSLISHMFADTRQRATAIAMWVTALSVGVGLGPEPGLAFAAGAVFGTVFVRRQSVLATPLLDLRLFRNRAFTGALLTLLLGMTALNGVGYLLPRYLQAVLGLSPLTAGLWLLPGAVGLILGSQLTPVLARRIRPAYVLLGGMLISVIGYAMTAAGTGAPVLSAGSAVIMFGVAPVSVLGTALAVGSAPPEKAGAAAATGQTAYDLGLALGIAVTGSLSVAVYRGDIPASAPEPARDTLGGAVASAEKLPDTVGDELLAVARDAFTAGFHAAALVSVAFALVTAVLVVVLLRDVPAIEDGPVNASDATAT
ncbi:MFS transporter [Streptomyces sp. NBC_01506]